MPEHSPSETILVQFILQKFDEVTALIKELPDNLLNTAPAAPGSNTPVQILAHCCGMARFWISTVNLGADIFRDREAEFTARLTRAEALALADEARRELVADLERTKMQSAPANPSPARHDYWGATCEGVLLHVFEELCQHLGHLEITRDVMASR